MKPNNIIKALLGIIATIILGAIGSGVWEKVLSPLLAYLSGLVSSTLSSLSSTYSNSIYSRAATLYSPDNSGTLAFVIFFIVFFGWLMFALSSKKENIFVATLHNSVLLSFRGWYGIILSGSFLIVVFFMLTRQGAVHEIQIYSVKQMEILRPYIGEEKYLLLRSDYSRMKNKEDFESFLAKLNASAKSASISIETFGPK